MRYGVGVSSVVDKTGALSMSICVYLVLLPGSTPQGAIQLILWLIIITISPLLQLQNINKVPNAQEMDE